MKINKKLINLKKNLFCYSISFIIVLIEGFLFFILNKKSIIIDNNFLKILLI